MCLRYRAPKRVWIAYVYDDEEDEVWSIEAEPDEVLVAGLCKDGLGNVIGKTASGWSEEEALSRARNVVE